VLLSDVVYCTFDLRKKKKDKLEDQASEMVKQFREVGLDSAINEMRDFFKSNILKILQASVPSTHAYTHVLYLSLDLPYETR
jgi:hypothetical protein